MGGERETWMLDHLRRFVERLRDDDVLRRMVSEAAGMDHNSFVAVSDALSNALRRQIVLDSLERRGWNVTAAARDLGADHSNLLRAVRDLGLTKEYEAAKRRGLARPGRPPGLRRGHGRLVAKEAPDAR